jgi:hypothetical protein
MRGWIIWRYAISTRHNLPVLLFVIFVKVFENSHEVCMLNWKSLLLMGRHWSSILITRMCVLFMK